MSVHRTVLMQERLLLFEIVKVGLVIGPIRFKVDETIRIIREVQELGIKRQLFFAAFDLIPTDGSIISKVRFGDAASFDVGQTSIAKAGLLCLGEVDLSVARKAGGHCSFLSAWLCALILPRPAPLSTLVADVDSPIAGEVVAPSNPEQAATHRAKRFGHDIVLLHSGNRSLLGLMGGNAVIVVLHNGDLVEVHAVDYGDRHGLFLCLFVPCVLLSL